MGVLWCSRRAVHEFPPLHIKEWSCSLPHSEAYGLLIKHWCPAVPSISQYPWLRYPYQSEKVRSVHPYHFHYHLCSFISNSDRDLGTFTDWYWWLKHKNLMCESCFKHWRTTLPESFQQDAEFLCSSKGKNWNENLKRCEEKKIPHKDSENLNFLDMMQNKNKLKQPEIQNSTSSKITFPPLSMLSCTFFRKSLSLHLFESRMVVAYVDSEMRMSGRHLSIHAALQINKDKDEDTAQCVLINSSMLWLNTVKATYPKCLSGVML